MKVRAKFIVTANNAGAIEMQAVVEGSKENESFFEATPSGRLSLAIAAEKTAQYFEVGKEYYLDFSLSPT